MTRRALHHHRGVSHVTRYAPPRTDTSGMLMFFAGLTRLGHERSQDRPSLIVDLSGMVIESTDELGSARSAMRPTVLVRSQSRCLGGDPPGRRRLLGSGFLSHVGDQRFSHSGSLLPRTGGARSSLRSARTRVGPRSTGCSQTDPRDTYPRSLGRRRY